MKKILLIQIILIPGILFAQSKVNRLPKDSAHYYELQMAKLWKASNDSLRKSATYKLLEDSSNSYRRRSNSYMGSVLYGDIIHSDFTDFNNNIAKSGFSPISSMSFRFGFGVSAKNNRTMVDFYIETIFATIQR